MEAEPLIQELVREQPGIGAIRLVSEAISRYYKENGRLVGVDWFKVCEDLVKQHLLIEIEFVTPESDRVKSFFFPVGTILRVKK